MLGELEGRNELKLLLGTTLSREGKARMQTIVITIQATTIKKRKRTSKRPRAAYTASIY